ncbi:MAG: DUF2807 domain-containing protein [Candidatus Melainabacteria bacterium]|nr:DUF2807 domain-containing protein [Candidatus Melainabacteria bacterium]
MSFISLATMLGSSGQASSPRLEPVDLTSPTSNQGMQFANIGTSMPEILLYIESAKVTIRQSHSEQSISLSSNCPSHWKVAGNSIRQVAMSSPFKGTVLRADAGGSYVVTNGKVYQLPLSASGAIRNLKVEKGSVLVNSQALEPMTGSDSPGSCLGPDVLEVLVPHTYKGGLFISSQNNSSVDLDKWAGNSLTIKLYGLSTFLGEQLKCFGKAIIDIQGEGEAQVKGLSATTLVANIHGSGRVHVLGGNADTTTATVTGSGSVVLKGGFGTVSKSVNGNGTIEVLK